MKHKIYAFILMAALLTMLSSCVDKTKGVSEKTVRQDIEEVFSKDDFFIELLGVDVVSVTVEDNRCIAKADIMIDTYKAKLTLAVTMNYSYENDEWVYLSQQSETLSAITKATPDDTIAYQLYQDVENHPDQSFYSVFNWSQFKRTDWRREEITDHPHGKVTYIYEDWFQMANTKVVGTTVVVGRYTYETGWTYAIEDWSYIETTEYNQFPLAFSDVLDHEDTWFHAGEEMLLQLYGKLTLTIKKDQDPFFTHDLEGFLFRNDVNVPVTVSPDMNGEHTEGRLTTYAIKISFDVSEDAYLFLWLNDHLGQGGDLTEPKWEGIDGDGNPFTVVQPVWD